MLEGVGGMRIDLLEAQFPFIITGSSTVSVVVNFKHKFYAINLAVILRKRP